MTAEQRRKAAARKRKKEQRRRRTILLGMLFILGLFILTVFVVIRSCAPVEPDAPVYVSNTTPVPIDPDIPVKSDSTESAGLPSSEGRFKDAVTVNNYVIAGKTYEEAVALLDPEINAAISKVSVTLKWEMNGQSYSEVISASDMNITSDLRETLTDALQGGKNKSYNTTLTIDYEALTRKINSINTALSFGPTDATFDFKRKDGNGKAEVVYTEGKKGMGLDVQATYDQVCTALQNGQYNAVIQPSIIEVEPAVTTEQLKKQVTLIGSYSTEYRTRGLTEWTEERNQIILNRAFNVEKATQLIDGQVIQPGKTWSYNNTVGDRNEKNGWKMANAIVGAETYRQEYGGGVCQVSTTLYNALLEANIQIVSRRKHSIPADYVPYGLDATVDTGHIDFKFKNDTDYPLYLFAYITTSKNSSRKSNVNIQLFGQALPEGVTYKPRAEIREELIPGDPIITYNKKEYVGYENITVTARNGYIVDVYLDRYVDGKLAESTFLYTDQYDAIRQKVTMGSKPIPVDPTPTPKATATPKPQKTDSGTIGSGKEPLDELEYAG